MYIYSFCCNPETISISLNTGNTLKAAVDLSENWGYSISGYLDHSLNTVGPLKQITVTLTFHFTAKLAKLCEPQRQIRDTMKIHCQKE